VLETVSEGSEKDFPRLSKITLAVRQPSMNDILLHSFLFTEHIDKLDKKLPLELILPR
jgi:hypothetical protein